MNTRLLLLLFLFMLTLNLLAELKLSAIFSSNMVLQQQDTVAIWGWAQKGESITIKTSWGLESNVIADSSGNWKTYVSTPAASYEKRWLVVSTKTQKIHLSNVLIGEVWLCAGQSNMGFRMKFEAHAATELTEAPNVPIRLFNIHYDASNSPLKDFDKEVKWEVCDSSSLKEFSAVAYYFGKMLSSQMPDVPIGLINSSYGGATAEAFMSKETLLSDSILADHYRSYKNDEKPSKNPTFCYNAMINPLTDYQIKGVAWYQGESNCVRASQYDKSLAKLITSWRYAFNDYQMPFYVIQLPAYAYKDFQQETGNPYSAATLRDAQLKVSQRLDNVNLVVTLDQGDESDIHPRNKKTVGERLATQVLSNEYGFLKLPSASPIYLSHRIDSNLVYLSFDHVSDGFKDPKEALNWFMIAGQNKKFYQGNAFIEGSEIVVSSPYVDEPAAVRYAWHNAAIPNLYNQGGLLTCPFRTDDWTDFTYVEGMASWSQLPDIRNVPFELSVPALTEGTPLPGKRVKQQLTTYEGTSVYHTVLLPTNWEAGKKYPVIIEYPGNGPYVNKYGDRCSGKPEDTHLGYGISGGEDFIWIGMPLISEGGNQNQRYWWGDVEASVEYTLKVVKQVCQELGGDSSKVLAAGFSRGAIACNYIGLHDDEIASLWCGFIANSHYDGVRSWNYPNSDKASALERLKRLAGRPQIIIQEGKGPDKTRQYLESLEVSGDFTYLTIPYRNHDSRWVLQNIPERIILRKWVSRVIGPQK